MFTLHIFISTLIVLTRFVKQVLIHFQIVGKDAKKIDFLLKI